MLQQDEPDDYVLATGEAYSVRQFVELSFAESMTIRWQGSGVEEEGVAKRRVRPSFVLTCAFPTHRGRPAGDASKARDRLGWTLQHSFSDLGAGYGRR